MEYNPEGDRIIASAHSNELKKYGWKFNRGNIPAAYLTGLSLGGKAKGKEAVLDLGLQSSIKGGRLYAALKGAIDGGLRINADESVFPKNERIEGKHVTGYEKNNIDAKEFEKIFKEVKGKIMKG